MARALHEGAGTMHRLSRIFTAAAVCLPLALAACGDDNDEALVGTFASCDGDEGTWVFGADGSFSFDENDDHLTGTYTADGRNLTLSGHNGDAPLAAEISYYTNDDHFVFGAAHADGDHDGLVGTWTGHMRIDEDGERFGADTTIELRADATGSIRQVPYDGSEVFERDGTWAADEDDDNLGGYELILEESENVTLRMSFQLIDDAVLGSPTFCRASN